MRWGQDPHKWLIMKLEGRWRVYPPVGSFWGAGGDFECYEDAKQDYNHQVGFSED